MNALMTPREEAISDCKYALSLGMTAYLQHLQHWIDSPPIDYHKYEQEYLEALINISLKLGTEECLLK